VFNILLYLYKDTTPALRATPPERGIVKTLALIPLFGGVPKGQGGVFHQILNTL